MKRRMKTILTIVAVIIIIAFGWRGYQSWDHRLVEVHQQFLYCHMLTKGMTPEETMNELKKIKSNDMVYNTVLKIVRIDFRDSKIRHLFNEDSPARLYFENGKYHNAAIGVDSSVWRPVNCSE